jgi:hypothetical protein
MSLALSHIESNLVKILSSVEMFEQEYPDKKEALASIFHRLLDGISKHKSHLLPPPPTPKLIPLTSELNYTENTRKPPNPTDATTS